jgi:SAM-dependent methyltransferase
VADGEQTAGWDAERTRFWLANLTTLEAPLAPVAAAIFETVNLQPGESVLDVGCGAGVTTIEAAGRVGPEGRVWGIDISADMITAAQSRSSARNLEWVVADAAEYELPAEAFDAIISRFGMMFFRDPARAFRRLGAACRPGGRMVASAWPHRERVLYFALPYDIVTSVLEKRGVAYTPIPGDQGPFSLGNEEATIDLLRATGWVDVRCMLRRDPLHLMGSGTVEQAADALVTSSTALAGQPDEIVAEVRAALLEGLRPWHDGTGIALPGSFLMITAARP